jgi:L-fuconolactonase
LVAAWTQQIPLPQATMHAIIDGHVHIWPEPRPGYEGRDVPGFPFPSDLAGHAEALIAELDAHGVAHAIAVQSPWWVHDNRYLIEARDRYPDRITAVACLPLMLAGADLDRECRHVGYDRMAGLRVHVSGPGSLDIFASDALDPIYRGLADRGLPLLVLSRQHAAHDLYGRVARNFPGMAVVVDHLGYATAPFGGTPATKENFLRLSEHANIHVKLALHHQHSVETYPWTDLHPFQRRILDAFGPERAFWGSNWPMKPDDVSYTQRIEVLSCNFPFRDAGEREWVMGRTAARLWPSAARRLPAKQTGVVEA